MDWKSCWAFPMIAHSIDAHLSTIQTTVYDLPKIHHIFIFIFLVAYKFVSSEKKRVMSIKGSLEPTSNKIVTRLFFA